MFISKSSILWHKYSSSLLPGIKLLIYQFIHLSVSVSSQVMPNWDEKQEINLYGL